MNFKNEDKKQVINVNDIDNLLGNIELIDIRETYEFERGSMRTAKNIPMGTLLENPQEYMKKETTYYIMCQSGGRSTMACEMLSKQGYCVINVVGGMGSYVGTKRQ